MDLPDPDGPMIAMMAPGSAYPVSPCRSLCVSPLGVVTVTHKSFQVSLAEGSKSGVSTTFRLFLHRVSLRGLNLPECDIWDESLSPGSSGRDDPRDDILLLESVQHRQQQPSKQCLLSSA